MWRPSRTYGQTPSVYVQYDYLRTAAEINCRCSVAPNNSGSASSAHKTNEPTSVCRLPATTRNDVGPGSPLVSPYQATVPATAQPFIAHHVVPNHSQLEQAKERRQRRFQRRRRPAQGQPRTSARSPHGQVGQGPAQGSQPPAFCPGVTIGAGGPS